MPKSVNRRPLNGDEALLHLFCKYDITKIKDITNSTAGQALIKAADSVSNTFMPIIPNPTQKVKTFCKKERLIAKWVRQQRAFAFERFTFQ